MQPKCLFVVRVASYRWEDATFFMVRVAGRGSPIVLLNAGFPAASAASHPVAPVIAG